MSAESFVETMRLLCARLAEAADTLDDAAALAYFEKYAASLSAGVVQNGLDQEVVRRIGAHVVVEALRLRRLRQRRARMAA